jgi:hypothetical protein
MRPVDTPKKETVDSSAEAASLLMSSWCEPLRLNLDASTLKKLHSLCYDREEISDLAPLWWKRKIFGETVSKGEQGSWQKSTRPRRRS